MFHLWLCFITFSRSLHPFNLPFAQSSRSSSSYITKKKIILNETSLFHVHLTNKMIIFSSRSGTGSRQKTAPEFLLGLLQDSRYNPEIIYWIDRDSGTFRLAKSKAVARMWALTRKAMGWRRSSTSYEHFSRTIRFVPSLICAVYKRMFVVI